MLIDSFTFENYSGVSKIMLVKHQLNSDECKNERIEKVCFLLIASLEMEKERRKDNAHPVIWINCLIALTCVINYQRIFTVFFDKQRNGITFDFIKNVSSAWFRNHSYEWHRKKLYIKQTMVLLKRNSSWESGTKKFSNNKEMVRHFENKMWSN